ncbi:hypothetical protein [Chitinophaga sp.]|uniref:glycosyl-4,4'-diaponeurosporenoate acyltransferase CrtO family protein n=1 Tax=Chitinophaga sp. TaxID=1869181 RepID=UPI0031D193B7
MAGEPLTKARQLAARYNLLVSLLWTLVCLGPVAGYFYRYMPVNWLWVIVPTALFPYFLPASWLDRYAVSTSRHFYERMGVQAVLGVVQHGRYVNRRIKSRFPGYRIVYDRETIRRKIKETYQFERFHYGLLLAFIIPISHAWSVYWYRGVILVVCNMVYNVYPILMQQYVRLRLKRMVK